MASSAASSAQALSTKDLWDRAMKQTQKTDDWILFSELLPPSRTIDSPSNVASIVADVKEKAEKSRNGRARLVYEACSQIMSVMTAIKDVGSAVTSLNPYASLAWGSVQFFLQAAQTNKEVKELCWDSLPRITYLISRYQTFEEVYSIGFTSAINSGSLLEDSLVKLYSSILRYQIAVVIYAGSRLERFKTAFKGKGSSKPEHALDEIRKEESEVASIRAVIDREITSRGIQQLTDKIYDLKLCLTKLNSEASLSSRALSEITSFIEGSRREEILRWISDFKYENSHRNKTAMPGTCSWLHNHEKYVAWRDSRMNANMWLRGFVGSGKSCLTHSVIETKRMANPATGEKLAFFYCDGTGSDSRRELKVPSFVLRSFIKQLALDESQEKLRSCVIKSYDDLHHQGELDARRSVDLILEMLADYSMTTFIIDGLDEWPAKAQRDLTMYLAEIQQKSTMPLKIFISGRPEVNYAIRELDIDEIDVRGHNDNDINLYVEQTVRNCAQERGSLCHLYTKDAKDQQQSVIEKLQNNAQGMFRWVELSFDYLHAGKNYNGMARRLDHLSELKNLFELYDAIWRNMQEELDEEQTIAVRTLLLFLLYGQDVREDIRENFDLHAGHDYIAGLASFASVQSLSEVDTTTIEEIVDTCSSFVGFEPPEHAGSGDSDGNNESREAFLTLQHFSVREYLEKKHPEHFSHTIGHASLASLCIDWCMKASALDQMNYYALTQWPHHLREIEKDLPLLLEKDTSFSSSVHQFLLDSYASDGWLTWTSTYSHVRKITTFFMADEFLCTPASSIFARVFLNIGLRIGPDEACKGYLSAVNIFNDNPLQFAVRNASWQAVHFLIDNGQEVTVTNETGNLLFYVPWDEIDLPKSTDTLERLIHLGVNVNQVNDDGDAPLHNAVDSRGIPGFEWLLQHGARPDLKGRAGRTALNRACARDWVEGVRCLLTHGASPNVGDARGWTPLHQAIVNGSVEIVHELLRHGAAPDRAFNGRRPPVFEQPFRNSVAVFEVLLKHGTDLSTRDQDGLTPLEYCIGRSGANPLDETRDLIAFLTRHTISAVSDVNRVFDGYIGVSTYLNLVAASGSVETVQAWIDHGANVAACDDHGDLPLDWARRYSNQEVVAYLSSLPSGSGGEMLQNDEDDGLGAAMAKTNLGSDEEAPGQVAEV